MNKALIFIVVLLVLSGIGVGLYYLLNGKKNVQETKSVQEKSTADANMQESNTPPKAIEKDQSIRRVSDGKVLTGPEIKEMLGKGVVPAGVGKSANTSSFFGNDFKKAF